ncbi:MAG: glycosyltransferase [Bacteroidetes bacterium]|nr:MAG: glycosyltransferase [Bacteroidota bacterium]
MISTLGAILWWGSLGALAYTYLIYPGLLAWKARHKTYTHPQYDEPGQCPQVSVLMAVHNEEKVLRDKLNSLLQQDYPSARLSFWIGSDRSQDATDDILREYAAQHPQFNCFFFRERQGKPNIINQLAIAAQKAHGSGAEHIFLITDASVILSPQVTFELARHFRCPQMAIVDARMIHTGMQADDISQSEDHYISWEGRLKRHESLLWQKMIGPFGGCYALRSDYFRPVPSNFLVDDFFITMQVFRQGGLAISAPAAHCYEPVGHQIREEFRRKARISAGNIQNMCYFPDLWWPPWQMPQFAFFSHKILRWLGPLWLFLLPLGAALQWHNPFFRLVFIGIVSGYVFVPVLDHYLAKRQIHLPLLRHVRYFLFMNLALAAGYIRYLNGIQSNVWQPPNRE